jgi:hypothetical protein
LQLVWLVSGNRFLARLVNVGSPANVVNKIAPWVTDRQRQWPADGIFVVLADQAD